MLAEQADSSVDLRAQCGRCATLRTALWREHRLSFTGRTRGHTCTVRHSPNRALAVLQRSWRRAELRRLDRRSLSAPCARHWRQLSAQAGAVGTSLRVDRRQPPPSPVRCCVHRPTDVVSTATNRLPKIILTVSVRRSAQAARTGHPNKMLENSGSCVALFDARSGMNRL